MNHGITIGTNSTVVDDFKIHDNDLGGNGYLYDSASDSYHRDGMIIINEGVNGPNIHESANL